MMIDKQVTQYNYDEFCCELLEMVQREKAVIVEVKPVVIGKWSMTRLWRKWMQQTAGFMAANGVTMPLYIDSKGKHHGSRPFSAQDAHELFTDKWLGTVNGKRLSWAKQAHDGMRPATKGERLLAMQKHEAWATQHGITLLNPRESEYRTLSDGEQA